MPSQIVNLLYCESDINTKIIINKIHMKPTLLILAAGLGSRYGGVKQMDKIGPGGESIIDYSVFDAIRAGFGKVVFVLNSKIEKDFKEIYDSCMKHYKKMYRKRIKP